jgi:hypothetical protein
MDHLGRIGEVVGHMLIEVAILLGLDLRRVLEPDRLARVERLLFSRLDPLLLVSRIFLFPGDVHDYGMLDVVRILPDHLPDLPLLKIRLILLPEV